MEHGLGKSRNAPHACLQWVLLSLVFMRGALKSGLSLAKIPANIEFKKEGSFMQKNLRRFRHVSEAMGFVGSALDYVSLSTSEKSFVTITQQFPLLQPRINHWLYLFRYRRLVCHPWKAKIQSLHTSYLQIQP